MTDETFEQGQLATDNEVFFSPAGVPQAGVRAAMDREMVGFGLDAPTFIDLSKHTALPLFGVRACAIADTVIKDYRDEMILIVVREQDGTVHAGEAFFRNKNPRGPGGPPPANALPGFAPPKGHVAEGFVINALDRIDDLRLRAGSYLATVILKDRQSNTTRTHVQWQQVDDPEVLAYLESQRQPAWPLPLWPAHGTAGMDHRTLAELADAQATDVLEGYPDIPETKGIAFTVPRVIPGTQRATSRLKASFRLPIRPPWVVRPEPDPPWDAKAIRAFRGHYYEPIGDDNATAVVPISFLLTGDVNAAPHVISLRVPTYNRIPDPIPEGFEVTGNFSFDLFQVINAYQRFQTWYVWAIAGDSIDGPVPMAVFDPRLIPEPGE